LPPEYPFKPPHIVFLTLSGRFETNTKVCLSFSAFHPELWQPAWGIRLILEALISFLPTPADGAIGALDWTAAERKQLARKSVDFQCAKCGPVIHLLPKLEAPKEGDDLLSPKKPSTTPRFAKEIQELQRLQMEREGIQVVETTTTTTSTSTESKEEEESAGAETTPKPTSEAEVAVAATGETKTTDVVRKKIATESMEKKEAVPSISSPSLEEEKDTKQETTKPKSTDPVVVQETTLPPQPPPQAAAAQDPLVVPPQAAPPLVVGGVANAAMHADPSWMIDPLLQFMIVLLAVIIYLLLLKFQSLQSELDELVHRFN
jgi:ubiquitin-conjugating enzyme E2 J1